MPSPEAINSLILFSIVIAFWNRNIVAVSSQAENISSNQLLNNKSQDNQTGPNSTSPVLPLDIDLNYSGDINLTDTLLAELALQKDGFNAKGEIDIIPISLFCLLALCFCFALINDLV
ncbi:hypothetical protein DdX_15971 [Ditylenchus destructor]|uniref:Uncharacterized protein n=1 Tax=Ditylenchus destructor TaxID=166010 RepID=A0AAD4MPG2_9BILA|nr:hypothetical protein DdX_15971 [Ditylenchus destructor]